MSRPKPAGVNAGPLPHSPLRLRRMEDKDVDAVMAIESVSYEFPWSEGIFRDCIRVVYRCRVLEENGEMVGYAVMSVGAGESHVLNVCVCPDARGRGHGRILMMVLIDLARALGAEMKNHKKRPTNHTTQAKNEKLGFN